MSRPNSLATFFPTLSFNAKAWVWEEQEEMLTREVEYQQMITAVIFRTVGEEIAQLSRLTTMRVATISQYNEEPHA